MKFEIINTQNNKDIVELENKKVVQIPREEIQKSMIALGITRFEAVQMWLDDNGYTVNETVEALTKKAKANKTDKIVASDKTKTRKKTERTPTENPDKEYIIAQLYQALAGLDIKSLKVTNKTKIIEFQYNNKSFKLDLVQKREKKA